MGWGGVGWWWWGGIAVGFSQRGEGRRGGFMKERKNWSERSVEECWRVTRKAPVSVRRVATSKGGLEDCLVRSWLTARDFKGRRRGERFAEAPPLEAKRLLISRAATRRRDGWFRKMFSIDVRRAHLNPKCEEDVYIELPGECGAGPGICGKLHCWLYSFRKAVSAWEALYA